MDYVNEKYNNNIGNRAHDLPVVAQFLNQLRHSGILRVGRTDKRLQNTDSSFKTGACETLQYV